MDKQELVNILKAELNLHPDVKDVEETDEGLVVRVSHVAGFDLTIRPSQGT